MKRYFKRVVPVEDSELGAGMFWIEFDGELPSRQVERYGDRWFSSRDEYEPGLGGGLADQPLSEVDLGSEHEISAEEFEAAWEESGRSR
jgi:hypothetical protein